MRVWPNTMALQLRFLLPLLLLFLSNSMSASSSSSSGSISTVDSQSDDLNISSSSSDVGQWQILTKLNFSSQIALHPLLLLMVTVPWSGESRALMNDIADAVCHQQEKFANLKLMLLYRSSDQMLADAIAATEGITIIVYHNSLPYKYKGRLRVQNILSSVHYFMSLLPEEIPLKPLTSVGKLKTFLKSTDKALLLLEFCGWTTRLLAKGKNNGTENVFEGVFEPSFDGEINGTLVTEGMKNQKGMQNGKMSCDAGIGFPGIPQLGEFSFVNETTFREDEDIKDGSVFSCTIEDFQRFESFFAKFMIVVRDFFLPPEKLRFGLVSERSLLSSLGFRDSGSWLMMLHFAGCPSCSLVLREGDDLKKILQMPASPVPELNSDEHDLVPALPGNKPSMILFIDRSSNSVKTRRESSEALDIFRQLAVQHQISNHSTGHVFKPRNTFRHPRSKLTSASEKLMMKNKVSVMIMNEGKHVTLDKVSSDLQGSSLRELLEYVLQKKKEIKLSSLAKDAGFQLLSDDFNVKLEAVPAENHVLSNEVSGEPLVDDLNKGNVDLDSQISDMVGSFEEHEKQSRSIDAKPSWHSGKKSFGDLSTPLTIEFDENHDSKIFAKAADVKVEEKTSSEVEGELPSSSFKGSFFFADGHSRFLKALTGGSKVPLMVILDPISQQHYVFPEEAVKNYSLLCDFLDRFLRGSVVPYQLSESAIIKPKEASRPPFVNLDFHEADPIPRVTANTFSELVYGNQSDSLNAGHVWKKDVLVLFSNSWCGFCQRMELVLREVYRAFQGYANMLKTEFFNMKSFSSIDDVNNIMVKIPVIYLMDCTLNDCSLILNSIAQRELYPSLLLFPAESKNAVSYGGDIAVSDIIKFVGNHGSNSRWFFRENGLLWTKAARGNRIPKSNDNVLHTGKDVNLVPDKGKYYEVLLKDSMPEVAVRHNHIRLHMPNGLHETALKVIAGSILVATDRLLNSHPFDKSRILIVKVNQSTGFQGLIINKHISWESLSELDKGLKILSEAPLSFGGPVIISGMPLVALTRKLIKDEYPEVLPNVYFIDQWATIEIIDRLKSGNLSIADYWFFLGYSSWGWGQLFEEIADGAWNTSHGNLELINWPSR